VTTPIILASTSPYRRALLERLRVPFTCVAPDVDEDTYKIRINEPEDLARILAEAKTKSVSWHHPDAIVIGSDQVAAVGKEILGKPGTFEKAHDQLRMMAGQCHHLYTGVAVGRGDEFSCSVSVTVLRMRPLTDDEIDRYLRADEPYDCCGSYKFESLGISLFDSISTPDPTGITGLPLMDLADQLRHLGIPVP
jgi:septum formation protein